MFIPSCLLAKHTISSKLGSFPNKKSLKQVDILYLEPSWRQIDKWGPNPSRSKVVWTDDSEFLYWRGFGLETDGFWPEMPGPPTTKDQLMQRKGILLSWMTGSFWIHPNLFDFEMRDGLISSNCHGQITQLIQENRSSIMASMSVWISFFMGGRTALHWLPTAFIMSTTPSQASLHTSLQHQVVHHMARI